MNTDEHGSEKVSRPSIWRTRLLLVAAVAAIGLAAGRLTGAQTVPPELQTRVEQALGAKPADCGRVLLTSPAYRAVAAPELRKAVACVTDHAARRTPAWMVAPLQGVDSWVAEGLMVGRDGKVRRYGYDSDPSGGSGATPTFSDKPCGTPGVSEIERRGPTITCDAVQK